MSLRPLFLIALLTTFAVGQTDSANEGAEPPTDQGMSLLLDGDLTAPVATQKPSPLDGLSPSIQIALILTVLTVLPAALMTMTSFTRIVIVLGFVRRALAVQEMPPNQVVIGLSMFLTILIMNPILSRIHEDALTPLMDDKIGISEAAERAGGHLSTFLLNQTREEDLVLMVELTGIEKPATPEEVPLHILIPSFALSELRTAFQMGFLIYLPFLIVDLVVSSILLSMGMFMLPPVIISTPFKILLFVLVDGWGLVVRSLVLSFDVPAA